VKLKKWARTRR